MSFDQLALLRMHRAKYPLMQPQDCLKLLYQSEFGPAHLGCAPNTLAQDIQQEWQSIPAGSTPTEPEAIGGGLCRFPLRPQPDSERAAQLLARLLLLTAQQCHGDANHLRQTLLALGEADPEFQRWLDAHPAALQSPIRHSATFHAAYHPHYRLLRREYSGFFPALLQIQTLLQQKNPAVIAIDGRCGSGKTQFAALLQTLFPCRVFHTDHYYLPVARRSPDWQQRPAGNMDLDRLYREVVQPARAGAPVQSRVFTCMTQQLEAAQTIPPAPLTIVEGSYSMHPRLVDAYDLCLFLSCSDAVQKTRLKAREGAYFDTFLSTWIPMEERYYAACNPLALHPTAIDTSSFFCESAGSLSI